MGWRRGRTAAALLGGVLLLAGGGIARADAGSVCALGAAEVFRQAGPSVVEVVSIGVDPFRLGDRIRSGSATGFFVKAGFVVTNFHAVVDATSVAILEDGGMRDAEIVGVDPSLDVALLRAYPEGDGAPLPFAAEAAPEIGSAAFAIGFPLGIGKSISAGIVSGDHRILPRTTSSWLSPYLQTDAAVSPGNSGGPLLDACGRVVGMVTMVADAPGAQNLGFAVPVSVLAPVVEALAADGRVARPWHGLYGQMANPLILSLAGYPEEAWEEALGFLVETVEPGSAADRAGLRGGVWPMLWGPGEILLGGDIITEVNGRAIRSIDDALAAVRGLVIGDSVRIAYLRDGERLESRVTIEERPLLEGEIALYRMSR
jgi:S1-C subfamily serine protease